MKYIDQYRCKFTVSTLLDQLKRIKKDTMYISRRVVHENLVTMETRLKIEHQIATVSLLYDRKLNLPNLRGIQQTGKNV